MSLLDALPGDATLLDALALGLRRAAAHNPNDTVPPAVILWTDKERQWAPLIPALRARLPLLTLGGYDPAALTGPAYWLRCAFAGVLEMQLAGGEGTVPIVYLPGVSRADLRAVESCPAHLQPLAELQYRGVFWSHRNGRDWSILAFLQSTEGGLGIRVEGDDATRDALRLGLEVVAREPLAALVAAQPLKAAQIHEWIHPDARRSLLLWLNDPDRSQTALSDGEWTAFLALCHGTYNFQPERDGPITGVRKLAERKGAWARAWQLFAENPERYPGILERLSQEKPDYTQKALFEPKPFLGADDPMASWPVVNDKAESALRHSLRSLAGETAAKAREVVLEQEALHAGRREWVWAKLGRAPLAMALQPLVELAHRTELHLGPGTTADVAAMYANDAWQTDRAMLHALAIAADLNIWLGGAILAASSALYRPWLEAAALTFQDSVLGNDGFDYPDALPVRADDGACLIFVDALRFDLGQELAARLRALGHEVSVDFRLAALPPVTPTAKPAVSPVSDLLRGGNDFNTMVAPSGPRTTAAQLAKLIAGEGYQVLSGSDLGDPEGQGWTEFGQIDTYGHNNDWMVAKHGLDEVARLSHRINQLLAWGWREVIVVTDHGWLLLPAGLPTAEIPLHLTEVRKGRCARLKDGSTTDEATVPWHWDPEVRVAMAADIRCYEAGKVYEHGGLSPQECVTPVVRVGKAASAAQVVITQARWTGLKCRVQLTASTGTMTIDVRTSAADPSSSVAHLAKPPDPDGTATIFLASERDDLAGEEAYIVVVDANGAILAQQQTVIGE
ncbi:MAG: BREX-1 system phosphatase PglZ type B [Thermomicrobiales bacterium]|nr:BREX-1 system phosphatase PglZ type B [Thermomicrobiales bacterium]